MARIKLDEQAALAAGASPLAIKLYKAHGFLAMALLVWTALFVLFVALYHAMGRPQPFGDIANKIMANAFIVLWLASVITLFLTNFVIRRLYVGAFVSIFLHGFFLLFPLLNAFTMAAMAPDMPGQSKPKPKPKSQ